MGGVNIYRGVTTGLNQAFIIDNATKEALAAADPKSAEIIKPVLRGRDIQRFRAQWAGLWLIYSRKGIEIERYPAVYQHLLKHYNRLSQKTGRNKWYELQGSPSDNANKNFAKEKLVWIELVENGRFAYDNGSMYGEATTFMMTGSSLKYLCAVLNSSLTRWVLQQISPTSGMGTFRWKKIYVENIPVPKISAVKQRPFVRLVDEILAAKDADPKADTGALEQEIDRLVYDLYGLTEEEITAIEGA